MADSLVELTKPRCVPCRAMATTVAMIRSECCTFPPKFNWREGGGGHLHAYHEGAIVSLCDFDPEDVLPWKPGRGSDNAIALPAGTEATFVTPSFYRHTIDIDDGQPILSCDHRVPREHVRGRTSVGMVWRCAECEKEARQNQPPKAITTP